MRKTNLAIAGMSILLVLTGNVVGKPSPDKKSAKQQTSAGTNAKARKGKPPNNIKFDGIDGEIKAGGKQSRKAKVKQPASSQTGGGSTVKGRKAKSPDSIKFDGIDGEIRNGRKPPRKVKKP